jgi:hypothetical protein
VAEITESVARRFSERQLKLQVADLPSTRK